jgi:serine/threonine-protein kinase
VSAEFLVQNHRIGRYILKRALGEGGYGQVYLAWQDNAADEPLPCVLKFPLGRYAKDEQAHRRCLHEARLAMRLGSHPNVVHVIDVGAYQGMPFIAMEYVDGADLELLLGLARRRRRGLSIAATYNILASAATGLHHAHAGATIDGKPVAIVHRDIKPANLLISRDGVAKLTDFGIGVALEDRTTGNHWRGTPRYMSPEHLRREVRPEMDVYGLGVVAWELVENRVYREGCEGPQHYQPTMDGRIPPMLNKATPAELAAIIVSCLDPNPRRRPTALELVNALSRCPGYSRDPDVLKQQVGALIGTQRRSGASQQHFAATPELVATLAVLAHPLQPAAPAWVEPVEPSEPEGGEPSVSAEPALPAVLPVVDGGMEPPGPARVEATLEVEADAPRVLRRPRTRREREMTELLGAAGGPPQGPTKTPLIASPWFDHERATPATAVSRMSTQPDVWAARGLTEAAPASRVVAREPSPSRSLFIHTFVSIGGALMAAALTAQWLGVESGGPAEAVVMPPPAVTPVGEARPEAGAIDKDEEAGAGNASEPKLPPPALAGEEPRPATMPIEQVPSIVPEPPLPIEPAPAPSSAAAAPAEASAAKKAPTRPKPAPRVSVSVVLWLMEEADIEVPAGTHQVRWRRPNEEEWRDAGRKRFEASNGYLVKLRSTGAEVIPIEGGGKR